MSVTPSSKSQVRLLKILKLSISDSYQECGETLEKAGFRRDAIPAGGTWRTAAKLDKTQLVEACKLPEWEDTSNDRDFS